MTVKELETILCTVNDKDMDVCLDSYGIPNLNGYYMHEKEDKPVFMLTALHVQPRV